MVVGGSLNCLEVLRDVYLTKLLDCIHYFNFAVFSWCFDIIHLLRLDSQDISLSLSQSVY